MDEIKQLPVDNEGATGTEETDAMGKGDEE